MVETTLEHGSFRCITTFLCSRTFYFPRCSSTSSWVPWGNGFCGTCPRCRMPKIIWKLNKLGSTKNYEGRGGRMSTVDTVESSWEFWSDLGWQSPALGQSVLVWVTSWVRDSGILLGSPHISPEPANTLEACTTNCFSLQMLAVCNIQTCFSTSLQTIYSLIHSFIPPKPAEHLPCARYHWVLEVEKISKSHRGSLLLEIMFHCGDKATNCRSVCRMMKLQLE